MNFELLIGDGLERIWLLTLASLAAGVIGLECIGTFAGFLLQGVRLFITRLVQPPFAKLSGFIELTSDLASQRLLSMWAPLINRS